MGLLMGFIHYTFIKFIYVFNVVSEEQLEQLKLTQKQSEIKEVKVQLQELENAYTRRKSEFENTLASLEDEVKKLEPAKKDG